MAEIAVGIDLGTSNSCVAVARDRQVEVLSNAYGETVTASGVSFKEDGSVMGGNSAKANPNSCSTRIGMVTTPVGTSSSAPRRRSSRIPTSANASVRGKCCRAGSANPLRRWPCR